jgi:hypothetical protein
MPDNQPCDLVSQHFPRTQNHHPVKVDQHSNHGEELHALPENRCVSFTARFPSGVDNRRRGHGRGVYKQQRPPQRRMAVFYYLLSELMQLVCAYIP